MLIIGNSILEGVGTALLIPPVYILTTMLFRDITSRARAFGRSAGMGGIGAAAGPLIGGADHHGDQLARRVRLPGARHRGHRACSAGGIQDPLPADPTARSTAVGAVLSAVGLFCVVLGILAADNNLALMAVLLVVGGAVLAGFFLHVRRRERAGKEPLLSTALFRNRTSNLGLVTQNVQWLLLMGTSFVVSVFLQVVRGYDAIQTGVIFTAATARHPGVVAGRRAPGQAPRRSAR